MTVSKLRPRRDTLASRHAPFRVSRILSPADCFRVWLPGAMVARLASIADGTKRLQVRVLRWSSEVVLVVFCFGAGISLRTGSITVKPL